ncbi:Serine/threonine-protein kinase pakC [Psilocybe cubensis]|uniref:Serine/threonine-protein kinase pakC n=2 Tax=Psilocybe cubensis TaxID=181762 RepID=A0ACB8GMM5_PSICU|nr:Serine/threonine-protein kinase pakC [Psilocybe cubensis]KAH9476995.1 Serine/threonine-protein kinase pakC [Psilocybe cubensis]
MAPFKLYSKPPPLPPKDPIYQLRNTQNASRASLVPDSPLPASPSVQYAIRRANSPLLESMSVMNQSSSNVSNINGSTPDLLSPQDGASQSRNTTPAPTKKAPLAFLKFTKKNSPKSPPPQAPDTPILVIAPADEPDPPPPQEDDGISMPWNFQHHIHVDEGFVGLPPSWSTSLAAAGFTEEEIAAIQARRAAGVRSPANLQYLYNERPQSPAAAAFPSHPQASSSSSSTTPNATVPIIANPTPRTTSLPRLIPLVASASAPPSSSSAASGSAAGPSSSTASTASAATTTVAGLPSSASTPSLSAPSSSSAAGPTQAKRVPPPKRKPPTAYEDLSSGVGGGSGHKPNQLSSSTIGNSSDSHASSSNYNAANQTANTTFGNMSTSAAYAVNPPSPYPAASSSSSRHPYGAAAPGTPAYVSLSYSNPALNAQVSGGDREEAQRSRSGSAGASVLTSVNGVGGGHTNGSSISTTNTHTTASSNPMSLAGGGTARFRVVNGDRDTSRGRGRSGSAAGSVSTGVGEDKAPAKPSIWGTKISKAKEKEKDTASATTSETGHSSASASASASASTSYLASSSQQNLASTSTSTPPTQTPSKLSTAAASASSSLALAGSLVAKQSSNLVDAVRGRMKKGQTSGGSGSGAGTGTAAGSREASRERAGLNLGAGLSGLAAGIRARSKSRERERAGEEERKGKEVDSDEEFVSLPAVSPDAYSGPSGRGGGGTVTPGTMGSGAGDAPRTPVWEIYARPRAGTDGSTNAPGGPSGAGSGLGARGQHSSQSSLRQGRGHTPSSSISRKPSLRSAASQGSIRSRLGRFAGSSSNNNNNSSNNTAALQNLANRSVGSLQSTRNGSVTSLESIPEGVSPSASARPPLPDDAREVVRSASMNRGGNKSGRGGKGGAGQGPTYAWSPPGATATTTSASASGSGSGSGSTSGHAYTEMSYNPSLSFSASASSSASPSITSSPQPQTKRTPALPPRLSLHHSKDPSEDLSAWSEALLSGISFGDDGKDGFDLGKGLGLGLGLGTDFGKDKKEKEEKERERERDRMDSPTTVTTATAAATARPWERQAQVQPSFSSSSAAASSSSSSSQQTSQKAPTPATAPAPLPPSRIQTPPQPPTTTTTTTTSTPPQSHAPTPPPVTRKLPTSKPPPSIPIPPIRARSNSRSGSGPTMPLPLPPVGVGASSSNGPLPLIPEVSSASTTSSGQMNAIRSPPPPPGPATANGLLSPPPSAWPATAMTTNSAGEPVFSPGAGSSAGPDSAQLWNEIEQMMDPGMISTIPGLHLSVALPAGAQGVLRSAGLGTGTGAGGPTQSLSVSGKEWDKEAKAKKEDGEGVVGGVKTVGDVVGRSPVAAEGERRADDDDDKSVYDDDDEAAEGQEVVLGPRRVQGQTAYEGDVEEDEDGEVYGGYMEDTTPDIELRIAEDRNESARADNAIAAEVDARLLDAPHHVFADRDSNRDSSRSSSSTLTVTALAAATIVRNVSVARRAGAYVVDNNSTSDAAQRARDRHMEARRQAALPALPGPPASPMGSHFGARTGGAGSEESTGSSSSSSRDRSSQEMHPTPTTDGGIASPLLYYLDGAHTPSPTPDKVSFAPGQQQVPSSLPPPPSSSWNRDAAHAYDDEDDEVEFAGFPDEETMEAEALAAAAAASAIAPSPGAASRPTIVISDEPISSHGTTMPVSSAGITPETATPLSPFQQYRGWLSDVVAPLEEFIDEAVDPRDHYLDLTEIAEGESGSVFAALLNPATAHKLRLPPLIKAQDAEAVRAGQPVMVAIKSVAIVPSGSPKLVDLQRELSLMRGLGHENVLGMDGVYVDLVEDSLWVRMELMERSLADIIALVGDGLQLQERTIARFASDVLCALEFLQKHHIAHRDVRSDNLLLNKNGVLKLADFSNAVQVAPGKSMLSDPAGVVFWQAPEVRRPPYDALKVDVWSLGATVWEMAQQDPPFADTKQLADRWPPLRQPELYSPAFHEFLRRCSEPAAARPSPSELLKSSFIVHKACGRHVIVLLLSQCMAIEKLLQEGNAPAS